MNSVLLAFNTENMTTYLKRSYAIVHGSAQSSKTFTVLHLCAAHVLKAVSQGIGQKAGDKSVKEYATYCFAALQTSSIHTAVTLFYHICVVFLSKEENVF